MFHSPRALSLYAIACLLPVSAGLVAGCATHPNRDADLPVHRAVGFESAERALEGFSTAWNSGDRPDVLKTFIPARRDVVGAVLRPPIEGSIESAFLQRQCHPRGAFWKTAVVEFRTADGTRSEIVWLRAIDGEWWMYAL